jgi:hypothetical protein
MLPKILLGFFLTLAFFTALTVGHHIVVWLLNHATWLDLGLIALFLVVWCIVVWFLRTKGN